MDINCELLQVNERFAVVSALVTQESKHIKINGTALAKESGRYVELAQARALLLARQLLEQGLDSLNVDDYLTVPNKPVPLQVGNPSISTSSATLPSAASTAAITNPVSSASPQPDVTIVSDTLAELDDLPDIPW